MKLIQLPLVALLAASAGVWHWVYKCWKSGLPIIAFARRRPVPWLGRDVFFLFLLVLLLSLSASLAVEKITGGASAARVEAKGLTAPQNDGLETEHPAVQLLQSRDGRMIALAIVMAVIVAPFWEELLFRVVLQGWLETLWRRKRREIPRLRAGPWAWGPLVLPALLFANIHYRAAHAPLPTSYVAWQFLGQMAAELALLVVAIVVLRFAAGATAADLGWQPRKLATDAKLAGGALVAIAPLMLVLQGTLKFAVKQFDLPIAPDPIPLFFLALVFGVLYQRTHRMTPSLLLHAAFNATSIGVYFIIGA